MPPLSALAFARALAFTGTLAFVLASFAIPTRRALANPPRTTAVEDAPATDDSVATPSITADDSQLHHTQPTEGVPPNTPKVTAVISAAYATAGLAHDSSHSWTRRARLSGLIPWLTVRTTRDTSWQDDQSDVGHATTLELRATWRLDRLLFDGRELEVATIETARHRERRRLATRVIRAYFAWRRAAVITAGSDERAATRLAETIAELDALTDGWFSDELSHPHRRSKP